MNARRIRIHIWFPSCKPHVTIRMNSGVNASNLVPFVSWTFSEVLILYAFVVLYCLSTLNPLKNVALVQPEGLNPEPKVLCYKSRTSRGVWWSGVRCIYFILAVTFGFWAVVLESFYQQPIFREMGQKMSDCTKPGLISSNGAGSTNGRPLIWIRKNIFFLLAPCYSLFLMQYWGKY